MPGLVKIGCTAGDPSKRMRQLFSTGVPTPFILEYHALVADYRRAEREAHIRLREKRENKEFFRCDPAEAIATIETLGISILSRTIRAETSVAAESRVKLFQAREKERAAQMLEQKRIYEAEARERHRVESAEERIRSWVGWPLGLLVAIYTAQVVPQKMGGFAQVILSLAAGAITGLVVGSIVAGFFVSSSYFRRLPRPTPSTDSLPLGVASCQSSTRAQSTPEPKDKELESPANNRSRSFRFKWWYLLLLPPLLKAIGFLFRSNG